jgi:DNA-binding Lrp family transcriptional regulator
LGKQVKQTMQKKLRTIDVLVLEGLALHGPRNISRLANQLNISPGALRHRIRKLRSHFSLDFTGSLYHTNIGLRKVVVFVESKPGYEEILYQCLKSNDYWLYVSQCIGSPECLAIYGIPAGKEREFENFLSELEELDVACNVEFFWSTSFQNINTTSMWFDKTREEWVFPWDSWLQEALTKKGELPYTLKDPLTYSQMADWIDIMILKELERDYTIKLKEIAKKLGISLQRLRYHFRNHIIEMKMLEGHQIVAKHYEGLSPDTYYFRFVFKNHENFTKFACSLMDKPFVRVMGKVYGKNELFVQVYLPRQELRNFIERLSELIKAGFLETYEYVIQDLTKTERQSISYEFFKDNDWIYEHKKHLERLQSIAKTPMQTG